MTYARLVVLLLLITARASFAQQPPAPAPAPPAAAPTYPVVRVGMVSYLQYQAELENRDAYKRL